jgi:hypothetical protein
VRKFKSVSKYGAKRTNGYASKLEAAYAGDLAVRKQHGEIVDWLEQVPVKLPGGIKYVCDFMLIMADGSVKFVETKGLATPTWKLKLRLLEECRPEVFARLEVVK